MSIEYRVEGSGPPFVYVCGIEGTGSLFYRQAADLARDHTVISFPLRGEGRYKLPRLVEDLAWVMRDAGRGRATVLGESFGGLLTMAAALEHPELFERMILVNTFPHFAARLKIHAGCALFSLSYPLMKAHRMRGARRVLFGGDVSEEDRRHFRERTRVVPREGYLSRLRIIRDTDLRPRLKEIRIPALVVAGTEDRLLDSVAAAKVMAAGLPRARLKLLEGTGHVALLSERVRVREWLAEFDGL
ncbi:MAG TPA: alpha/beta hydrolase [Pyrinomonadaceae bacterium]|jgi:pimeloyl-ACP methyl ester carboxylesterase|nr:alpha/beta hydrolase [Pyrinomonadaceae bacterium]